MLRNFRVPLQVVAGSARGRRPNGPSFATWRGRGPDLRDLCHGMDYDPPGVDWVPLMKPGKGVVSDKQLLKR